VNICAGQVPGSPPSVREPGPEPQPPEDDEPTPSLIARVRGGAWLDAQHFPPLRWAVDGIVPEGLGLLVAPPKAGKSWLALNIGLAAASGGRALGAIPCTARPVLYLALEDGWRRLQDRSRVLLGPDPIPAGIDFVTEAATWEVAPLIAEWLGAHRDEAPLVLLDTLGKVLPPTRSGETPYARDYRVVGELKALADSVPGCSLTGVHHTRKATGEDFVDAVSGTQGIAGAADFVLVLARRRQESDGALSVTGRDVIEAEYAVTTDGGHWRLVGRTLAEAATAAQASRATTGLGDRSTAVVDFVARRPDGTRAADVAAALDLDAKTAGEYLRRAEQAGRIGKATRGLYTPPVGSVGSVGTGRLHVVTSHTNNTSHTTTQGASVGTDDELPPTS